MQQRSIRIIEGVVLALAAGIRVAGLQALDATRYAAFPLVDAFTYWDQAQKLSQGVDPFAEGLYQPPGYPVFLELVGGLTAGLELSHVRVVQALLGLVTTALLIGLGRRLGARVGAPWAGALAGMLYTLYPTALLFEQDLLTPALTSVLLVGSLALLWSERPADLQAATPPGPGPLRAAAAGLLQGLAIVVHPTYLLAALASTAWLADTSRDAYPGTPAGRRLAPSLAFAAAVALSLAPTTWLNTVDHEQPALVSHNSGLNFFLGNNVAWRDTMFARPGLPFRKLVLEAEPADRDVAQRNQYWWDRAETDIAGHPLGWASTLATKALWSVSNVEIPRNEDYRCRTDDGPMAWIGWLPVRYGWLLPLSLAGAVLLARRRGPTRLLPAVWLSLHLPLLIFLVADRYRLATWPLLCLCAAAAAAHGFAWLRVGADRPRPAWAWALLLPAAVVPFLPLDARTGLDPAWCLHVDGNLAIMDGQQDEGAKLYAHALDLDPDDWGARDFLARTRYARGDVDGAATLMEPLLQWFPDHYPTLYFMARLEERRGNFFLAADYMGRAWKVPGDRTSTGVAYVRLLVRAGRRAEARQVVEGSPALQRDAGLKRVLDGSG